MARTKSKEKKSHAVKIVSNVRVDGAVLRALRNKAEFNQLEVEKACDIAENVLSAYENERIDVPLATAQRLADFFKVSLATILTAESMTGLAAVHNQIQDALGIGSEAATE